VLYRRERAVMLEPRGKGIALWTLRYGDEVREPGDIFAAAGDKKADRKAVTMVKEVIKDLTKPWDPAMVKDPVQDRLLEIIENKKSKKPRRKKAKEAAEEPATNVINLMDALRKSISSEKSKGSRK
jgi:DNA end-binding protein Ku